MPSLKFFPEARRITRLALVLIVPILLVNVAPAEYASTRVDANDLSFYRGPTTTAPYSLTSDKKVTNVIVCIGDGMGLNQIALARIKAVGLDGRLHMERMPVTGLVRTHSADSRVTDSAAAGTALATGVKTNNGMIGVTPDDKEYWSILEAARAKGMATGLVATSTISHATPASFATHVHSRKTEVEIAEQLLANRVNVLFGGGRKFFLPRSDPNSARKDDRNLIAEAKEAGYLYVMTDSELRDAYAPFMLGLFQFDSLTTAPPEPSLASLTHKAIDVLRQTARKSRGRQQGFFLMVEGSQIDWVCHDNDAKNTIRQTLLFDQAVEAAADFAMRDGRTLVIVTADHETGGLTFTEGKKKDPMPSVHWSTKGHTGSPVPIGAMGPGAMLFVGVYDNTDVPKKIAELLDIKPFPRPRK